MKNGSKRNIIRETLRAGAKAIAEDASVSRTDLLAKKSFDCVALGLDLADSINAENSVEKMLAHQMALAHKMAFEFAAKALEENESTHGDSVEANRSANTTAKLMAAFQNGALTLQKLRTGGSQTMTVHHVTIEAGGQAVLGNVNPRGAHREG